MNCMFDGICDYIVVYYYFNICIDFVYWQVCCYEMCVFENLQYLLDKWDSGVCFEIVLDYLDLEFVYLCFFWYCILVGMGCFNFFEVYQKVLVYQVLLVYLVKLIVYYFFQ